MISLNMPLPSCLIKLAFPYLGLTLPTSPPKTSAIIWWPKQTPNTGTSASATISGELPTSLLSRGCPGPGEIIMPSGSSFHLDGVIVFGTTFTSSKKDAYSAKFHTKESLLLTISIIPTHPKGLENGFHLVLRLIELLLWD